MTSQHKHTCGMFLRRGKVHRSHKAEQKGREQRLTEISWDLGRRRHGGDSSRLHRQHVFLLASSDSAFNVRRTKWVQKSAALPEALFYHLTKSDDSVLTSHWWYRRISYNLWYETLAQAGSSWGLTWNQRSGKFVCGGQRAEGWRPSDYLSNDRRIIWCFYQTAACCWGQNIRCLFTVQGKGLWTTSSQIVHSELL